MNYRQMGNTDVSEIALDGAIAGRLSGADFAAFASKAFELGINLFCTLKPEETSATGEALRTLSARRKATVTAGVADFFVSYAQHKMRVDEFLEHELADRLARLDSTYLDCFVIDLGRGRSVDLEAVKDEEISGGGDEKSMAVATYEGGTFLHETVADCLEVMERFKHQGRVRLAGISGENIKTLERVLVKAEGFDVAFVPYNYGFRAAGDELIPVAAEVSTSIVATRPLWWGIREIPITVLAESPYPAAKVSVSVRADALARAACKWPLGEKGVSSVAVEVSEPGELVKAAKASGEVAWTRADEEALRPVGEITEVQEGLLVILSAMNSREAEVRERGWAALLRKGLGGFEFDPHGDAKAREESLFAISEALVVEEALPPEEDLDELL